MWRYRITRLLSRKYPELVIPDELAAEGSRKREWNRFPDTHYRRGWNVNVSRVMDNATHVAVYFGSYLKKPPVPLSRLEHYAGQDEIGLRYNSHRTEREEYLVMSGDEFMERFSWHVADKGVRMVRHYGFLSPAKRRLLEEVMSLFRILCKCLFSEVTVQAVTELDNKAAHCHSPVLQRHRPFPGRRLDCQPHHFFHRVVCREHFTLFDRMADHAV